MFARVCFIIVALCAETSFSAEEKDIVDTAVAGGFNTLVSAVKAADLVEALKGTGPFTVFAPTDAAFAKLPPGTLQDLLKPENKARRKGILTYHVVSGKAIAKDIMGLSSAKTVNGQTLTITKINSRIIIANGQIATTAITWKNLDHSHH